MAKYILTLDQGTTSSRAIIFDEKLQIVGMSQQEFKQIYPQAGWVEHDPMDIFYSQYYVMNDVVETNAIPVNDIVAVGITNQRETTILWDRNTGEPIYNAIVWQCRRTAPIADELKNLGMSDYVRETTGLPIDAYFSATKIKWILDNVEGAREKAKRGDILFGTVETWLIWKLTNGKIHITDYTNASRTMLFDIHRLRWDERLLDLLDIPKEILPEVRSCSEVYGYIDFKGARLPISGAVGDQQAALFGQGCFDAGEAKNTYGTGCFLLMHTGDTPYESKNGLVTTIAMAMDGKVQYALEGSVFVGGAVIQWIRDELKLINDSPDAEYFAQKVLDTGGVYLVPAFTGLGAPHWDMYARGCIVGITRGTKREHLIRAAQESIAYQSMDLVRAIERDTGIELKALKVDGGASRDTFLMQFQADILDTCVIRPTILESTALGAASAAGLAVGVWKNVSELKAFHASGKVFRPSMEEEKRMRLIQGWERALLRSFGWAAEDVP